jgi:hypothetical protein
MENGEPDASDRLGRKAGREWGLMKRGDVRFFFLVLAIWPSVLKAQGSPTVATWTIPGIANVAGQNNTHFVSDVAVTNPGSAPAPAYVSFIPSGAYASVPVFLAPGQTVVWKNVLQQLWGASASGALQVMSDGSPLLIRARTYNDAATGTYGVALPVYTDDRFLFSGDSAQSLWVSQSPDATKGYRTNNAVLFPDSGGGAATVTVYDGDGKQIGQTDFSLGSAGVQQISVGKFASPADVARATIQVKSGRAAGYSAVVDNVTGDSSLFTFDDLPAGPLDVLINGVARANGKNSTFFRTDGRFFNPGSADVTVAAAFHANQNSNTSPGTGTFTVPAGKILDVTDVLGTLLGQPVGSSGAIRFTSDSPVGILCRTSNVDPTGAKPGTFGAQQKPVPILSFLMSADAGALITGVRQSPDPSTGYRTNIAMAAGGDGATAQFTLKTVQGVTVGTATQTLGAYGWVQAAVDKLFAGTAIPDDAEVLVKITQGSADVFDSSVDNSSGDSVVTPAPALPIAIPSSTTIGPAGGSVRSDDGRLTLKVPAGALSSSAGVSIAATTDVAPNATGPAYSISPSDLALAKPALLVFNYSPDDMNGSDPEWLVPAFLSGGGEWFSVKDWVVDTGARTVTSTLASLSPLAAVPAEQRAPAAAGGPVTYQLVQQLVLQGDSVVPPHGTTDYVLRALQKLRPGQGVTTLRPDQSVSGGQLRWRLNNGLNGAVDLGTLTPDPANPQAHYQTPDCPPPPDNAVKVSVALDTVEGTRTVYKFVSIFPISWTLEFDETADISCLASPAQTAKYVVHDKVEQDFDVDVHDGHLINRASRLVQADFVSNPAGCGTWSPCSMTALAAPSGLSISKMTGSVRGRLRIQRIDYQHIGTPPIRVICVGLPGPIDFPGRAGANDYSGGTTLNWNGIKFEIKRGGSGITYTWDWHVRWHNVDYSSCPCPQDQIPCAAVRRTSM